MALSDFIGPAILLGIGIVALGKLNEASQAVQPTNLAKKAADLLGGWVDGTLHHVSAPSPGNAAPTGTQIQLNEGSIIPTTITDGQPIDVMADIGHIGPSTSLWLQVTFTAAIGGPNVFEFEQGFQVDSDQGWAEYTVDMPNLIPHFDTVPVIGQAGQIHLYITDGNGVKLASSDHYALLRPA